MLTTGEKLRQNFYKKLLTSVQEYITMFTELNERRYSRNRHQAVYGRRSTRTDETDLSRRKEGKIMKKMTANVLKRGAMSQYGQQWYESDEIITCEVIGEWDTGTKIWQKVGSDDQYYLTRWDGHYNFVRV